MTRAMMSLASRRGAARQGGFTIVEMMVAMAISLIVVFGFAAIFVNMKVTFNSQNALLQLQDNERLAMTILTASVGEAGFFPNGANLSAVPPVPVQYLDRSTFLPSTPAPGVPGGTLPAATYLFGTPGDAGAIPPVPETLSTAYRSAPGDGLLSCQGGKNTTLATGTFRNIFYVDAATSTLMCVVMWNNSATDVPASAAVPLISGVTSMKLKYGVDSGSTGTIDRYKDVGSMSAADWHNVKNVNVSLTFINPNDANLPVVWSQTINVMNNK